MLYTLHLQRPKSQNDCDYGCTLLLLLFFRAMLSRSKRAYVLHASVCVYALIWPVAVAFMQLPNIYYRFLHNIVPLLLLLLLLFVHFFFICLFSFFLFFVMCVRFFSFIACEWFVHRINIARSLSFATLTHAHTLTHDALRYVYAQAHTRTRHGVHSTQSLSLYALSISPIAVVVFNFVSLRWCTIFVVKILCVCALYRLERK